MVNKKPIGLVVDNGADLPQEFIEKNQIEVVYHQVYFPSEDTAVYQMEREKLYQKMKELKEKGIFPKTSFASVGSFRQAYQKALEKFENVLALILTSKHSGAFNAANQAKEIMEEPQRVEVFDSLLVAVPQGILTMKAQELINQNNNLEGSTHSKNLPEILNQLKEFREKIKTLAFLDDFSWATAGGRLSEKIVKVIELFQKKGIRLAITIKNGKIALAGIKFSAKDKVEAIVQELEKNLGKMKVAISHTDCLSEAQRLREKLIKLGKEILFISEITPVLAAHAGPGALIVSYYNE